MGSPPLPASPCLPHASVHPFPRSCRGQASPAAPRQACDRHLSFPGLSSNHRGASTDRPSRPWNNHPAPRQRLARPSRPSTALGLTQGLGAWKAALTPVSCKYLLAECGTEGRGQGQDRVTCADRTAQPKLCSKTGLGWQASRRQRVLAGPEGHWVPGLGFVREPRVTQTHLRVRRMGPMGDSMAGPGGTGR